MASDGYTMAGLGSFTGREIGVSGWVEVDQHRIDEFAECTGDRQWIHVDVERARRESPFGGTIAHGYLTLSLAASLCDRSGRDPAGRRRRAQLRPRQGPLHRAGEGRRARAQSCRAAGRGAQRVRGAC